MRLAGTNKHKDPRSTNKVVIKLWIYLLLGIICIAFGAWGIHMENDQETLPAYVAWLGSAYGPTLRVTAALCFGVGVALVYRILRRP